MSSEVWDFVGLAAMIALVIVGFAATLALAIKAFAYFICLGGCLA